MKGSALAFALLFLSSSALAQRPVPPGLRQADQAVAQGQRDVPPPTQQQRSLVDPAKLRHDADELATLAQSVPGAIDQTTKGLLPRDLSEKLKRIEKLAKQLRSQVSR